MPDRIVQNNWDNGIMTIPDNWKIIFGLITFRLNGFGLMAVNPIKRCLTLTYPVIGTESSIFWHKREGSCDHVAVVLPLFARDTPFLYTCRLFMFRANEN